ncbi:hypothetical protein Tco_0090230 [Tanacetum coccineum]
MGVAKLLFGLRTCQPMYIGEAVSIFDNGLRRAIEAIVVCGGPFFGDFQWRLASLPIRTTFFRIVVIDGLILTMDMHWIVCACPSLNSILAVSLTRTPPPKAQNVLACALFSEIVKSLGVSFDLSPRQKAVVECLRAPRAQNFLTVIPIEGLGQHMSALEYRTILKYRDNGFVAGQAALKAESSKVAKHEKACLENQHVFIPFAFDTFGFLAPEAEEFLNRSTLPTKGMRSIISTVSISLEDFLPSILLLMVIIVAVVIVTVICVVVVDVIVGVVIVVAIIGVGVVVMIIGFCELCWWLLPESEVLKQ